MTKDCYFCKGAQKDIDEKNAATLAKFINFSAKIMPARRTKCCAKHQRRLAKAIKRSRQLGFLPFVAA